MVGLAKNFLLQSWLGYRGLFLWLNPIGYVSNVFLSPVFLVAIFGIVGHFAQDSEAAQAHMIGISVYSVALVTQGGVIQSMFYDRAFGTLSANFASTGSRLSIYLSRGLFHVPNGFLALVSSQLAAWLFLDLSFHGINWTLAFTSVMLITFSCVLFAMFVGAFAIAFRDWFTIGPGANGLTLGLTGAIIPVDRLPPNCPKSDWTGPTGNSWPPGLSSSLPWSQSIVCRRRATAGSLNWNHLRSLWISGFQGC